MMRIEIYHGGVLAAELEEGRAPVYHGADGRWVQAVLAPPRGVRAGWGGATATGARPAWPPWWAADMLGTVLAAHGFTVRTSHRPDHVAALPDAPPEG
jgi:hypothetical protein